jgi:hypothetical protein
MMRGGTSTLARAAARVRMARAPPMARRLLPAARSVRLPRLLSSAAAPAPPGPLPPGSEPGRERLERGLELMDSERVGEAIDEFARAAKAGSPGGNFFLGLAYDGLLGENASGEPHVELDAGAAFRCYKRAAEGGHAEAMLNLALCYRNGEGVARSARAAFEWTERSADVGSDRAMFNAGVALDPLHPPWGEPGSTDPETCALPKNPVRSAVWYRRAVEVGHSKAKVNLGILLYTGVGCEKDAAAAAALWREAADEGVSQAEFCLRNMEEAPGQMKQMFDER